MSDIYAGGYKLDHKRRPFIHTEITSWDKDYPRSSGVQVTVTKRGIDVAGWFDSFVGIEGFHIDWAAFDKLREQVEK